MDRLNDGVRRRREKAVDLMRAGDRFRFRPAVAFELGPDAREAGRLPIIIDSEPDDVFFLVSGFGSQLSGDCPVTAQGLDRAAIEPLSSFVGGSRCVSSDEAPPPKRPNNPHGRADPTLRLRDPEMNSRRKTVRRSISSNERPGPVELVVQADFDNLNRSPDVLFEIRLCGFYAGAGDENALGSKIHIVVLGFDGPILRECVLDPDADHPSHPRCVPGRKCLACQ